MKPSTLGVPTAQPSTQPSAQPLALPPPHEEINAVNLDFGTHLPNEKQQATFRCLPQETRNKVTCNIEEKRIEVLRDGRKDDQPQLPVSPSNNVLDHVISKNLTVGTNSKGNKKRKCHGPLVQDGKKYT